MEFFKKYFKEVDNWNAEEVHVLCPFHNDTHPSASINTDKDLFHCWVCNVGYNEEGFAARINNISTAEAIKLLDKYTNGDDYTVYKASLWADSKFLKKVYELGLSDDTIEKFNLGLIRDPVSDVKTLAIPVFYNNMLVDIRRYNLLGIKGLKKVMSTGDQVGFLIPYDMFIASEEPCYILEGEKDMLMARELGINAYTLTGGAGAIPNEFVINAFENKDIILCYDNDKPGYDGMVNMFKSIKDIAKSVQYIKIGDVVKEDKEDFYDFVHKYGCDAIDFYSLTLNKFNVNELEKDDLTTIKKALEENKQKRPLKSVVTVTSEFVDTYSVPTIVKFEKVLDGDTVDDTRFKGEEENWYLEDKNMVQMLELIEVSAKDREIKAKLKGYVGIPPREPGIKITVKELKTVYKTTVVDKDFDSSAISLDLYSFDKLDVGGQYVIDYRIYPHPTKNQKSVAICFNSIMVHDNRNYTVNKELLSQFKIDGTIKERLDYLYQSAKHHIAKHLNYDIWLMTDLVFNSILDFNYGECMRGALDVFILGDTQVGKSETASKLVELYNFGHFLTLKTSTTVGLIGGSSKVDGTYCNTIGAIPRQHKRLVVLEEFSGARADFIKTMTDIRSSNELRLSRVSGELIVPCKLRMITTSNPVSDENGQPRYLGTFPNGVMPIMELIKSAEDVARYDGFLLVPRIEERFNPHKVKLEGTPIPKIAYQNKINWVATRQPENVIFDEDVESYIWEKAEELNKKFECNFPLFGVTASKKLARFCVALAALVMNVDDSFENIIVTKEIVDYMCSYLDKIYDSPVFKLGAYANEYKTYSNYTDEDIKELEKLYARNATLLDYLNGTSRTTRANVASVSGMENAKFFPIFNKLVANKFIRLNVDNVYPTDKFRKVYAVMDKTFRANTDTLIEAAASNNGSGVTFVNDLGKE
jgi:hypothetical protein